MEATPSQPILRKRHVDEFAAAEFLDVSVSTLRDWRFHRTGPIFCRFGRAIRYPWDELVRYAEDARVRTAA